MVKKIKYKIANIQLSKIVSLLGKILGIVVKEQEGLQLYNKIEEIRSLSKASRGTKNKKKINYNKVTHDDKLAKVSIIGAGMISSPGVTYKMFRSLSEEKINILAISTSEIKISVLIRQDFTQKAVKKLHKTFGLN